MPLCVVSIWGIDHEEHSVTVEASSIFDAADKGLKSWAPYYWWLDPHAVITVRRGEGVWHLMPVAPEGVRETRL